jgi:ribosomal protein L28
MASTNKCIICAKGTKMAGGYSNRIRATKFNPSGDLRKYPNLQWVTLPKAQGGGRIKICTRCIKGNKHLGTRTVKAVQKTQKKK